MKRVLFCLLIAMCLVFATGCALADVIFVSGDYTCSTDASGMATITEYHPETAQANVNIPAILNGSLVTAIGNNVFRDQTTIETLVMPDNITTVGNYAFSGCTSLRSIHFSSRLTSIGMNAFSNCAGLESVDMPDSVTSMKLGAFMGCTSLADVVLSSGLTTLPSNVFQNCSSLAYIEFPEGITSIGAYAFNGCTALKRAAFPDGEVRMTSTSGLNSVLRICHASSANAQNVSQFIDPTAPDWILEWRGVGISLIASGYTGTSTRPAIPQIASGITISGMAPRALLDHPLDTLNLPDSLTAVEDDALLETAAAKVVIPAGCSRIGAHAFAENPWLIYVYLPGGLTDIAPTAFDGCPHAVLVTQTADSAIEAFAEANGLGYLDLSAQ